MPARRQAGSSTRSRTIRQELEAIRRGSFPAVARARAGDRLSGRQDLLMTTCARSGRSSSSSAPSSGRSIAQLSSSSAISGSPAKRPERLWPEAPGLGGHDAGAGRGRPGSLISARGAGHPRRLGALSLSLLGVRAEKLVWDRESAIGAGGKPSGRSCLSAASCRWAGSPRCRQCAGEGAARAPAPLPSERLRAAPLLRQPVDFQDQLDRWAEKENGRSHRSPRRPAERLAKERALRPLRAGGIDTDRTG